MRSFIVAIAATLFLVYGASTASAQRAMSLTLSCTGTLNNDLLNKSNKVRIGVIVNFQTGQITGLGRGWEADLTSIDENLIPFHRNSENVQLRTIVDGTVDRITGSLMANVGVTSMPDSLTLVSVSYNLVCRPGRRLF
jgi:hypothetical protein